MFLLNSSTVVRETIQNSEPNRILYKKTNHRADSEPIPWIFLGKPNRTKSQESIPQTPVVFVSFFLELLHVSSCAHADQKRSERDGKGIIGTLFSTGWMLFLLIIFTHQQVVDKSNKILDTKLKKKSNLTNN